MKLIVGLGNPGLRYNGTRHNVGFDVLDAFAKAHQTRIRRKWCRSLVAEVRLAGEDFILAKPQTFMNNSGEAVREILMRSKIEAAAVLVVCDDVNLPLGRLRLRPRGSAGGHHGLESIIHCTRSSDFARLRIGIGEGPDSTDVMKHVLGRFHKQEKQAADQAVRRAARCIDTVITGGIEAAMNEFNTASEEAGR